MTEGLDGLRHRLGEYAALGARFAQWRAVITIGEALPSTTRIAANAHALARYAALCQEAGLVPIVEPEVLMAGAHTLEGCEEVTEDAPRAVFVEPTGFDGRLPWAGTFSFGRAIQQPTLELWRGDPAKTEPAQHVLRHRIRCNQAMRRGEYSIAMEVL